MQQCVWVCVTDVVCLLWRMDYKRNFFFFLRKESGGEFNFAEIILLCIGVLHPHTETLLQNIVDFALHSRRTWKFLGKKKRLPKPRPTFLYWVLFILSLPSQLHKVSEVAWFNANILLAYLIIGLITCLLFSDQYSVSLPWHSQDVTLIHYTRT